VMAVASPAWRRLPRRRSCFPARRAAGPRLYPAGVRQASGECSIRFTLFWPELRHSWMGRTTIRRWPVTSGPAAGALRWGIPVPAGGKAGQGSTGRAGGRLTGAASDDAVLTELYRQYHGPLLLFVIRLTAGDRQQAEDVVQETMVRAWREARRLDLSEPSLMPWLATVARRIVIDEHRRKRVRPLEIGGAEVVDRAPVAADETDHLLRKMLVTEALQALTPAQREVLNETILRDRTVNEAAEGLGSPVGTVKSRVYYALKALRVALAERGVSG